MIDMNSNRDKFMSLVSDHKSEAIEYLNDISKANESIKRKYDDNFEFFAESDLEMLYREGLII